MNDERNSFPEDFSRVAHGFELFPIVVTIVKSFEAAANINPIFEML
jgi:hypothetical protein